MIEIKQSTYSQISLIQTSIFGKPLWNKLFLFVSLRKTSVPQFLKVNLFFYKSKFKANTSAIRKTLLWPLQFKVFWEEIYNLCILKALNLQDKSPNELDAKVALGLALNLDHCLKTSIFWVSLNWTFIFRKLLNSKFQ